MNSRYDSSPAYAGNTLNMADRKTAFGMPESNSESNSTDNLHIDDPMSAHSGCNKKNAENGGCEKQQKKKSPTVLELVKTFGESTSMHGLARAIGDGPLWRRLIWAALVIGFAIWAAYNVVEIIQDFLGRPVLTTVSSEFQTKMIFPAVTFCNLNRVRNSKASANLLDSLKINLVMGGQDFVSNVLDEELRATPINNQSDLGHQLEDMLYTCHFGVEKCSIDNFTYSFNINQGNCYTFASSISQDANNWTTVKAGPSNGLRLQLNIEAYEYLPSSNVGGIKVLIHDNQEYPFPEDGGLIVGPGFHTSIGIKKTNFKRLSSPYGNCIESSVNNSKNLFSVYGYGYTRNACQKSCFQEYVYRNCSCCDTSYPCVDIALEKNTGKKAPEGGILYCNSSVFTEVFCVSDAQTLFTENKMGCNAACPPPCTQSTYSTSVSTGMFPTTSAMNTTIEQLQNSVKIVGITDYNKFLVESFISLEVYFDSLILEKVEAEPAYTWNKLLGDIGGQVGLLLGFSILTALEFVEFLLIDLGFGVGVARCVKGRQGKAVAHRGDGNN